MRGTGEGETVKVETLSSNDGAKEKVFCYRLIRKKWAKRGVSRTNAAGCERPEERRKT